MAVSIIMFAGIHPQEGIRYGMTTEDRYVHMMCCPQCGQPYGKTHDLFMTVTNVRGPDPREIPIGMPWFQHKCRRCNLVIDILWQ